MKTFINTIKAKFYEKKLEYYLACYETAINEGNDVEAIICADTIEMIKNKLTEIKTKLEG